MVPKDRLSMIADTIKLLGWFWHGISVVWSYCTHPEVSRDESSFSKGCSDATSLFCRLKDFSWTDTNHTIMLGFRIRKQTIISSYCHSYAY